MITIAILGSFYFRDYMNQIQAEAIFSDINLCFVNTFRPQANYQDIAREVEDVNAQIAILGISDYIHILPYLTVPSFPIRPDLANFIKIHPNITDYSSTAFVFRYPTSIDLSLLERALHIKYNAFFYNSPEELPELLSKLKQRNFRTIVSNNSVCGAADALGFETFYYYNKKNLVDGIQNALVVYENTKKASKTSNELNSLLNTVPEGVIAVSRNDFRIQYINSSALNILNCSRKEMDERSFTGFISLDIVNLCRTLQSPETDFQYHIGGTSVFGSIIPLKLSEGTDSLVFCFEKVSQVIRQENSIRRNIKRSNFSSHYSFEDIIGKSDSIKTAVRQAKRFAERQPTILIQAETGSGKEVFAQSIHAFSSRKDFPFIAISCGAVPDTLIESELFGYVSGAFTGANSKGKVGLLETANHGTVLLDDIDALSSSFQAKLLRVMQEREIIRVGGNTPISIDVRFICATNSDLKKLVSQGKFRNDLYYRVNVLQLKLPPLRERLEDIPLLLQYYLEKLDGELYHSLLPHFNEIFSPAFNYPFPGNVRELINYVERFSVLADETCHKKLSILKSIAIESLGLDQLTDYSSVMSTGKIIFSGNYQNDLANAEAIILKHYIDKNKNISKLSSELGMSRSTLYNKIKEYGL